MKLDRALRKPVIGALKSVDDLGEALSRQLAAVVLLRGDIFDVITLVERSKDHGLVTLIHVDLVEGIGRDAAGMRFLAERVGINGIITTKAKLARDAKDAGLMSVLRLFLLDSQAYKTGVELLRTSKPDAVEMLPGLVLPHLAQEIQRDIHQPIIAGGLIRTPSEVRDVLAAGAKAVTTSQPDLWSVSK